jgi:hypothetical protein
MRTTGRVWLGLIAAWAIAFAALSLTSRSNCNVGGSTAGCGTFDELLLMLFYVVLPAAILVVSALIILTWQRK